MLSLFEHIDRRELPWTPWKQTHVITVNPTSNTSIHISESGGESSVTCNVSTTLFLMTESVAGPASQYC